MKKVSNTTPKVPDGKAILLMGPPGGGKTTLALQFPDPYLIDADQNLDGPTDYLSSLKQPFSYAYDTVRLFDDGKEVPIELCMDRAYQLVSEADTNPEVKTIITDSLTYINEFGIEKVLFKQKRKDDVMETSDWIPFRKALRIYLVKLRSLKKTTITTCHEDVSYVAKMMSKTVDKRFPAVSSNLKNYLGGFFTDIWRCTRNPGAGGKDTFTLETGGRADMDLKCSVTSMPNMIKNVTFEKINEHMKLS